MAGSADFRPTRVACQARVSRSVRWRQLGGLLVIVIALVGIPITHAFVQAESSQAPAGAGRLATARIGTGVQHTCVIQKSGDVRCWGRSNRGQLGGGNTATVGLTQTPGSLPAVRLGGRKAVSLAVGANHSCALLDDSSVRCWGRNDSGQLGIGNNADLGDNELPDAAPPAIIGDIVAAVTAGANHTCVILASGAVKCWGNNDAGQLGVQWAGNIGDDEAPQQAPAVALGRPAVAISAGGSHTLVHLPPPAWPAFPDTALQVLLTLRRLRAVFSMM